MGIGKRRLSPQYISDDDDDDNAAAAAEGSGATNPAAPASRGPKRQRSLWVDDSEDELELEEDEMRRSGRGEGTSTLRRGESTLERLAHQIGEEQQQEEEDGMDAVPIGDPVRCTAVGTKHYAAFKCEGKTFKLGDTAMFKPELETEKPYVGLIKDITDNDGSLSVTAQWFYRPDEAEKKGGEDPRELFYSFHNDDVAAGSAMHTVVVHFIPSFKQIPSRKVHPGFIVQKVYDTVEDKLYDLTDKDYEDDKQHEIDCLVKKTMDHIGELPDLEPAQIPGGNTFQSSDKRGTRKRSINRVDASRVTPIGKSDPLACDDMKNFDILFRYGGFTGERSRDMWRDKLVDTIILSSKESGGSSHADPGTLTENVNDGSSAKDTISDDDGNTYTLDVVVSIMASLETSTYGALGSDFKKYNQKLRQLHSNIKKSPILRRRLMKKELDPAALLIMKPDELKDGLTPEEKVSEPEESKPLEMIARRCQICTEQKVGLIDIVNVGGGNQRYQLECTSCGYTCFASVDAVVQLVDDPITGGNV